MMLRHGTMQSSISASDRSAWCCQHLPQKQQHSCAMHVSWRHATAVSPAVSGLRLSSRRHHGNCTITRANVNNDPSVKALEAAMSAINKLLSAHQQITVFRQGKGSANVGGQGQQKGKSKVINFSAKASSNRAVKASSCEGYSS
jgi:hypothetical protein